ncbi:MAG TPA: TetR/AcrR family transcriptional regulator [Candidatus Paceibacterota bacterium]|nr:TetR/AcrR family transcriptional regulator [Verrucomicrobiota bacterium]HSA12481.1 TetR/AcrR family transcriptional regulator [Candidatus Paceibacterota bacterium]
MAKPTGLGAPLAEPVPAGDPAKCRILEGARRHFFAHGFRGVSMDDLAAELGMSKKTLYSRFATKHNLLEAVIDEQFRRVSAECEQILAVAGADFPKTLQAFLACLQRYTAEIQPPFIKDIRQEAPETFQRVERLRRAVIERYFGELMRRGRAAGFIRKDIPAALIMEILLAALRSILNPVRMEELDLTVKSGCSLITKVVLEGAMAPGSNAAR